MNRVVILSTGGSALCSFVKLNGQEIPWEWAGSLCAQLGGPPVFIGSLIHSLIVSFIQETFAESLL